MLPDFSATDKRHEAALVVLIGIKGSWIILIDSSQGLYLWIGL